MRTATDGGSVRLGSGPGRHPRRGPDGRVPGRPSRAAEPSTGGSRSGWPGGSLGDGRGLTAPGAALVALGLGLAGVAIDAATGTGLRTAFAVSFVIGCAAAAALVHHEDLMATVVMPPLLFVGLAAAGSILDGGGLGGGWVTRRALDVVTAMVTDAPVLFVAMGAVLALVAVRLARYRASVRHRRRASRPGPSTPTASA